MSFWLGVNFAGYYSPIREVVPQLLHGHMTAGNLALVVFFTAVSLFDFGYFREQFCNYVCPYGRFQASMMDRHSLIIAYDKKRGEPRTRKGEYAEVARSGGDCVNCTMCVQACPNGIDIREGLQPECIACGACVDACNSVMDKVGKPHGLIRYSSLAELEGETAPARRPRLVAYGLVWTALVGFLTCTMLWRGPLELDVNRAPSGSSSLGSLTPDGRVVNVYRYQLTNHTTQPLQVELVVEGLSGAELVLPGNPLALEGAGSLEGQFLVTCPRGTGGVHTFKIAARSVPSGGTEPPHQVERSTTFLYMGQPQ